MSRYTIRIDRTREECKKGKCGHPHEIPFTFKQKQIVCSDLSCREDDVSLVKHILVPYDGSPFSNRAFEFALDLASKYNSSITVCTVMSDSFFDGSFLDVQEPDKRIVDKEKIASMEKYFEKIRILSKKFMIPIKTEAFVSSSVSDSLVAFANSNKVDLIVMGTRGKGDNRLMLGSVSIGVSQKASAPVLLIK
ncbi:MAG: universal stress protein [Thaumarchaeota archaeon]|nr:universal stress protein [Nitrososphaerota archaeon]